MNDHRTVLLGLVKANCSRDRQIVGAEVGVATGRTSAVLLEGIPNLKLYMVDRWAPYPSDHPYALRGDHEATADIACHERRKSLATTATNKWARRRTLVQAETIDAPGLVHELLDFMFIDADHHEDGCYRDMVAWYPKLKAGGLFCGHDYGKREFGVTQAVNRFCEERGIDVIEAGHSVWCSTLKKDQG
jgi:hypothetical protein